MAILHKLAAYSQTLIDTLCKAKVKNDPNCDLSDYTFKGKKSFELPTDIAEFILKKLAGNKQKLDQFKSSGKTELRADLLEFNKMCIGCFGAVSPTAIVDGNTISAFYEPKIYRTNPTAFNKFNEFWGIEDNDVDSFLNDYPLCVAFGNSVRPLEYNADESRWETVNFDLEGASWCAVYFASEKTNSPTLPLISKVKFCIQDSNKPQFHFEGRIQTVKKDSKDSKMKTDAVPADKTVDILNAPDDPNFLVNLQTCIDPLPSGGGYEHQFHNDEFEFGLYPVVSLKKSLSSADIPWEVYIVKVVTEHGVKSIQLPNRNLEKSIFNLLANIYDVEQINGEISKGSHSLYKPDEESEEDELLAFMGMASDENQKPPFYAFTYLGKYDYVTNKNNPAIGVDLGYEEISEVESTKFRAFTNAEVLSRRRDLGLSIDGLGKSNGHVPTAEEQIKSRMASAPVEDIDPGFSIKPSAPVLVEPEVDVTPKDVNVAQAEAGYADVPDGEVELKAISTTPKSKTKKTVKKTTKTPTTQVNVGTDLPGIETDLPY